MVLCHFYIKQITKIHMDNLLISSDPQSDPKGSSMERAPASEATPTPKKKSFFTTGKILAIVGIAVVVIAIVGAIIYSQTSERFQGASFTTAPAPITIVTTTIPLQPVTALICADNEGLTSNPAGDACICDVNDGFVTAPSVAPAATLTVLAPTPPISCLCEEGRLFNSLNNTCEPVNYCDLSEEEVKRAVGDRFTNVNTRIELQAIMADYTNWHAANCGLPLITIEHQPLTLTVPKEELTCNDYINDFRAAYANRNWDAFQGALTQMVTSNCISNCDAKLYWTIFYLYQDDIASAERMAAEQQKECTDCNTRFEFLAVVAQVLSDIDRAQQEIGNTLNPAYTEYLKNLVTGYIQQCQCIEVEAFLDNPVFNVEDTFPDSTTDDNLRSNFIPLTYTQDDVLVIAYAQSSTLSPTITSVLEDAVQQLCDVPEVNNCTALEIVQPSSTDLEIIADFSPATDNLEFNVTGTDDVQDYKITSLNGTIGFNETGSNINTENTSATLSGGPAEGESDTIIVQAVDVTGLPLNECKDSLKISRASVPTDEPVCRNLKIVAPAEAQRDGSPEFIIPASGFINENLTVQIDGDQGSWGNIKYNTTSENGDITFNDQATLSTTDLTVTMDGKPSGQSETITVWALDPETNVGIDTCHDSFTVKLDDDGPPSLTYTPPEEEEDDPPSLTYTPPEEEEDDPPILTYTPPVEEEPPSPSTYIPPAPVHEAPPEEPTPAPVLHAAAPATPQTGPGVLIPIIGLALGGAWMRRKRK